VASAYPIIPHLLSTSHTPDKPTVMSSVRQEHSSDIYDSINNNSNNSYNYNGYNGGAGMRFGSDVEGDIVRLSVGNMKGESSTFGVLC